MHLIPYLINFRSRLKKRLLIPDQNWDKSIYNFPPRIKKRLLIPDQSWDKNIYHFRSRVKKKLLSLIHITEKIQIPK
jgi:hypothetical protein